MSIKIGFLRTEKFAGESKTAGGIVPAAPRALGGELSGYTLFLTPNRARIGRRGLSVIVK